MPLNINLGNKKEEPKKEIIQEKRPEAPQAPQTPQPDPGAFKRFDPPAIDMEALKAEVMQGIKEEEDRKKAAREKAIKDREKELEKAEAALKEEKENLSNNKKFNRKSKMLAKNSPEGNEDYYVNYQIRLRNQKMRSTIFTFSFYLIVAAILACNFYFIFIKKETPLNVIEGSVKKDLYVYMFPTDGVQEYLEDNLPVMIQNNVNITGGSGAGSWNVSEIRIRKFNLINDSYANVYFSADFDTAIGTAEHDFIIALKYDYTTKTYSPASDLVVRSTSFVDSVEMAEEDDILWGFGENRPSNDTDAIESFLTQYFTMLYNNKTVPSAYLMIEGDVVFDNEDFTFDSLDSVEYYGQVTNYMGANLKVIYNVKSTEGLTFSVTTYMYITDDGHGSFKITKLY